MKQSRFSEEPIVGVLKEAEAGVPVKHMSDENVGSSAGHLFGIRCTEYVERGQKANTCAGVRVPPSPITSRVPSPLAAYRMPACHGRRTDCLPVRPLASTYARCDHRRRRNTHPIRAS